MSKTYRKKTELSTSKSNKRTKKEKDSKKQLTGMLGRQPFALANVALYNAARKLLSTGADDSYIVDYLIEKFRVTEADAEEILELLYM